MPVFVITMLPATCSGFNISADSPDHEPPSSSTTTTTTSSSSSLPKPSKGTAELQLALKKHGGHPVLPILAGDVTVHASPTIVHLEQEVDDSLADTKDVSEYMPHGPFDTIVMRFATMREYKCAVQTKDYENALLACQQEHRLLQHSDQSTDDNHRKPSAAISNSSSSSSNNNNSRAKNGRQEQTHQNEHPAGGQSSAENGDREGDNGTTDTKQQAARKLDDSKQDDADADHVAEVDINTAETEIEPTATPTTTATVMASGNKLKPGHFQPHVFAFEQNSVYIDWIIPTLKNVYRWLGYHVDCKTPVSAEQRKIDSRYDLKQSNGDTGIEKYKTHVSQHPNQRCYMLQMLTKDTISPHGKQANTTYNKAFVEAMFSCNVTMHHCGNVVCVNDGPKAFQQVYILEFPSREMYIQWVESEYFNALQKEREASILDSFVQLGLPMY